MSDQEELIHFFWEDLEAKPLAESLLIDWIKNAVNEEEHQLVALNYIFCSDEFLLQMNQRYLKHDTYTDVISFDQSDRAEEIEGDIYISWERVQENAQVLKQAPKQELARVLIHGLLHFLGYSDKNSAEKEAMRLKEDYYLARLGQVS